MVTMALVDSYVHLKFEEFPVTILSFSIKVIMVEFQLITML